MYKAHTSYPESTMKDKQNRFAEGKIRKKLFYLFYFFFFFLIWILAQTRNESGKDTHPLSFLFLEFFFRIDVTTRVQ